MEKREGYSGERKPMCLEVKQNKTKQNNPKQANTTGIFSDGKQHKVPNVWSIDFEEG